MFATSDGVGGVRLLDAFQRPSAGGEPNARCLSIMLFDVSGLFELNTQNAAFPSSIPLATFFDTLSVLSFLVYYAISATLFNIIFKFYFFKNPWNDSNFIFQVTCNPCPSLFRCIIIIVVHLTYIGLNPFNSNAWIFNSKII